MYVTHNKVQPRHRYLRRVTLDSLLEHGQALYGDSDEEKELLDECVDMTEVSRVSQLICVRRVVDYVFERQGGACPRAVCKTCHPVASSRQTSLQFLLSIPNSPLSPDLLN